MKLRQTLIDRKQALFPKGVESEESANLLANLFFNFAATKPKQFGVYKRYAAEETEELIAHYEHDLSDAALKVNAEHLTRIAQALYIMKTPDYENIWWKVEERLHQLGEEEQVDGYHLTNIFRAFSRS